MSAANAAFSHELIMLAGAKQMTLAALAAANRTYGDRARDEQEVLGLIADMVMDVYAFESALLRTQRLIGQRGAHSSSLNTQTDITRVFARHAATRVEQAARTVLTETSGGDPKSGTGIDQLVHRSPIKMIAATRRIGEAMIAAGKYNL
jgi:butyryl-CoA dehydrogenase